MSRFEYRTERMGGARVDAATGTLIYPLAEIATTMLYWGKRGWTIWAMSPAISKTPDVKGDIFDGWDGKFDVLMMRNEPSVVLKEIAEEALKGGR